MNNNAIDVAQKSQIAARILFDGAKRAWGLCLFIKLLAGIVGIFFAMVPFNSAFVPWVLAFLVMISEVAQWRSDVLKSRGEGFLRKIEFHQGLNWNISSSEFADLLARMNKNKREHIENAAEERYFSSEIDAGAIKALQNLRESSWWSRELAATMFGICAIASLTLTVGSLIALGVAVNGVQDFPTLANIARVVCSMVSIGLSLGLVKLVIGYQAFSKKAEDVSNAAKVMLHEKRSYTEIEVASLLHEYQIGRNGAPLIPTWVWRLRRDALNDLWQRYNKEG